MADDGNSASLLMKDPEGELLSGKNASDEKNNLSIVSPSEITAVCLQSKTQARSSSAYLNLSIIETQGNNSWCGAYVTAAIIRYLNGSTTVPTASGLMAMFYRRPTSSNQFPMEYTVTYAESMGYHPTKRISMLGSSEVFAQINSRRPLYLNMPKQSTDGTFAYHALVLHGYSRTHDTYSVWNPWYSYSETMDMITKTYTTPNGTDYRWCATIYDW